MAEISNEQLRRAVELVTIHHDPRTIPPGVYADTLRASIDDGPAGLVALAAIARAAVQTALGLVDKAVGRPLSAELGIDVDEVMSRIQMELVKRQAT